MAFKLRRGVRVDGGCSLPTEVALEVPDMDVANVVESASESVHLIVSGSTSAPTSLNDLVFVILVLVVMTVPAWDTGPLLVVTLVDLTLEAANSDFRLGSNAIECGSTSLSSPGRLRVLPPASLPYMVK